MGGFVGKAAFLVQRTIEEPEWTTGSEERRIIPTKTSGGWGELLCMKKDETIRPVSGCDYLGGSAVVGRRVIYLMLNTIYPGLLTKLF